MGVYRVTGTDRQGHRVSRQGSDLEQLLAECRQDAWDMVRYIAEKDQSERA